MKELGKYFLIIFMSINGLYAINNYTQLNTLVDYIKNDFYFNSRDDKKLFISNQNSWLNVAKMDCKLIYSDIGAHSSFLIYYNACLKKKKEKRFDELLHDYICKYTDMSEEKCEIPKQFKKIPKNQILMKYLDS